MSTRFSAILSVSSLIFALLLSGCASHSVGPRGVSKNMTWDEAMAVTVKNYTPYSQKRLAPYLAHAQLPYPPKELAFLIFKDAKQFELYGRSDDQDKWHFIKQYHIYAASGGPGPKLAEGDRQVPEGVYHIVAMNPKSRFDLSMQLDYPNDFDRKEAAEDHRDALGGNIFIHGDKLSVGCIALGNDAIQEIFPLVYAVGEHEVTVIIVPDDLRKKPPLKPKASLQWLSSLYSQLQEELKQFPEA